jgi:hypothetical protein
MANFKKVGDIAFVESVVETDTLLIERDGTLKRAPANGIGGGGEKLVVLLDQNVQTKDMGTQTSPWKSDVSVPGLNAYFLAGKKFKIKVFYYLTNVFTSSETTIDPSLHNGAWLASNPLGGQGYSYFQISPKDTLSFYFPTSKHPEYTISRIEVELYE